MNKSDFPIFNKYPELVYLDSAATSQKPSVVLDEINNFYTTSNANVHRGLYRLSEISTQKYEASRSRIAKFLNVDDSEIIFTQGTTDGMNAVAQMFEGELTSQDVIITTKIEHHSSLLPFQRLAKRTGSKLKFINSKSDLRVDIEHYKTLLSEGNVKIVVISGMSNVTGYITPLKEITGLAHESGALIIVDGAQLIAHKRTDIKSLNIDFLSFSGHKVYGPTGIGVLYGKSKHLEKFEPFRVGGGMITRVDLYDAEWRNSPEKFEAGTPNIEGAIGLAKAIDYIDSIGFDNIERHEKELFDYAFDKLSELGFLDIYSIKADDFSGVLSFNVKCVHSHDTADILGHNNVAVRAGHHCCQILMRDVLKVDSTVRASFGIYNDKNDIDKFTEVLKTVKSKFN